MKTILIAPWLVVLGSVAFLVALFGLSWVLRLIAEIRRFRKITKDKLPLYDEDPALLAMTLANIAFQLMESRMGCDPIKTRQATDAFMVAYRSADTMPRKWGRR